jgi:ABC-type branched-subunit amino acid transport system permease subunit
VSFLVALLFPARIGRLSYFIRDCVIALLFWGLLGGSLSNESDVIATILLLFAYVYWVFWVVLPRMRDLSMPPFRLILMAVPVLNLVFALILTFRPSAIAWPRSTDTPPPKTPLC